MDPQTLVMAKAGNGVAPEQIGDTAAAQKASVVQHLDVLAHSCQGLLGGV
jgi:hypothetical protein